MERIPLTSDRITYSDGRRCMTFTPSTSLEDGVTLCALLPDGPSPLPRRLDPCCFVPAPAAVVAAVAVVLIQRPFRAEAALSTTDHFPGRSTLFNAPPMFTASPHPRLLLGPLLLALAASALDTGSTTVAQAPTLPANFQTCTYRVPPVPQIQVPVRGLF